MDYNVDVLIQNIKTLCTNNDIPIAQFWNDIFGVQKKFSRMHQYPPTNEELERIAKYFHVTVDALLYTKITPSPKINGEILLNNIRRLCNFHQTPISNLDMKIFGTRKNFYQWKYNPPSRQVIQQIADFFNVPIESLIEEQPNIKQIAKQTTTPYLAETSDLKILFRNAPNLTADNLNTINDMVSFLLDKQKKQNNDH